MKREKQLYESYVREFEELKKQGCKLYYPDQVLISPKKMAKTIVRDPDCCYMRDPLFNRKGEVVSIQFNRVR